VTQFSQGGRISRWWNRENLARAQREFTSATTRAQALINQYSWLEPVPLVAPMRQNQPRETAAQLFTNAQRQTYARYMQLYTAVDKKRLLIEDMQRRRRPNAELEYEIRTLDRMNGDMLLLRKNNRDLFAAIEAAQDKKAA
jgi:hypothetical protein